VWVSGRAVIQKEQGGVRAATSFEVHDGALLALRVELENLTEAPMNVGPDGITFMTCLTLDKESCDGSWAVVDPEAMLASFDERRSREIANAYNQQVFDGGLLVLSAVSDVAVVSKGRSTPTTGLGTLMIAQQGREDAANARATLTALASDRATWENLAFRRTTIAPGSEAAGLVYIPIHKDARYVWLHVRAADQVFAFGFKQTRRELSDVGRRPVGATD